MRLQQGNGANSAIDTIHILSISPDANDHISLGSIFGHSRWMQLKANNLFTARALLLQRENISVILCEADLKTGTWMDILKHIRAMSHPPSLIVTSRLADDRLWSIVLNEGGWDLLSKPFDYREVLRCVKSAWEHWYRQNGRTAGFTKVMSAAG
jgi:DNA-binding response OmpR family regulator